MMINLIKADLYKEFRKKSFKYFLALIIFVSIVSLLFICKNDGFYRDTVDSYSLFSEEEYYSVNKYGDYQQYILDFSNYNELLTIENEILTKDTYSKAKYLLNYLHNFLFLLGILIAFISYNSLSYDYQNSSLRYAFLSKYSRKKILSSKLISLIIISIILFLVLVISMLVTVTLLTSENIFSLKTLVFYNDTFRSSFYICELFKDILLFLIPFVFVVFLSMFLCVLFRGNSFGLILTIIVYLSSLFFSQILFNYGYVFVEYTFLPYIDFTYYVDDLNVAFNNMIYNISLSYKNAFLILSSYSILFFTLMCILIKRDL